MSPAVAGIIGPDSMGDITKDIGRNTTPHTCFHTQTRVSLSTASRPDMVFKFTRVCRELRRDPLLATITTRSSGSTQNSSIKGTVPGIDVVDVKLASVLSSTKRACVIFLSLLQ